MDINYSYYYNNDIRETPPNYENHIKRIFLNECIRQLHIMTGSGNQAIHITDDYNKLVIWHLVNDLIKPAPMTERQILLQKVKRRLFLETRKRLRKCKKPKRNLSNLSEAVYFKTLRCHFGVKNISRFYMQNDLNHSQERNITNLDEANEWEISPLNLSTCIKMCKPQGNMVCDHSFRSHFFEQLNKRMRYNEECGLSRKVLKVEEMLLERQYRQLSADNDKYLEASIRSTLYMKAILSLVLLTERIDDNM